MERIEPMWIWSAAGAALLLVLLAAFLRGRARSFAGRLSRLESKVAGLRRGRNNPETLGLLRQLHGLAHAAVVAGDEHGAYKTVELIKTVYGQGIARPDEPELIGALAVRAVRGKHPEIASAALDAFRLLFRSLPPAAVPAAAEQLTNVTSVALREEYNFLAAKAADIIIGLLEKTGREEAPADGEAALRVLNTVGVLSLRRRDGELFREIITRLDAVLPARLSGVPAAELTALVDAWLHRIIQNDDGEMYAVLADFTARRAASGQWLPADLAVLIREWHSLAGFASLKPGNPLASAIAEQALRIAHATVDAKALEASVAGAGQTARLAVQRHGLADGFPLVLPLLELGRELLALELKFGSAANTDSFRRQALYLIVRESLAVAEFAARQDMISTAGDIIAELHRHWLGAGRANAKAVKRFCQLLAAYWLQTRKGQAKRAAVSDELTNPALLSESDLQRLGILR